VNVGSGNKLMKSPDIHISQTGAVHDVTLISLLTTWNEVEGMATYGEQNRTRCREM